MDADTWMLVARLSAIFAGIVFGSIAIGSVSWVWVRRQIFAFGGSALCGAGVILLGLSIWHSVKFGAGSSGVQLELSAAALRQEIRSSVEAAVQDNMKAAFSGFKTDVSSTVRQQIEDTLATTVQDNVTKALTAYRIAATPEINDKFSEILSQIKNNKTISDVPSKTIDALTSGGKPWIISKQPNENAWIVAPYKGDAGPFNLPKSHFLPATKPSGGGMVNPNP